MNRSIFICLLLALMASVTGGCKKNDNNTNHGHHTVKPDIHSVQAITNFNIDTTCTFIATVTEADTYLWDFGDGTTSTATDTARHTYHLSGHYMVSLIVANNMGSDTATFPVGMLNFNIHDFWGSYNVSDSCKNYTYSVGIGEGGWFPDMIMLSNFEESGQTDVFGTIRGDSIIITPAITHLAVNNYQPDTVSGWGVIDIAASKIYITSRHQINMFGTHFDWTCPAVYTKQ